MPRTVQVSAEFDRATKALMDRFVRATGMKQGHLIEEAVRRYILAWEEVPAEFMIPARVVLTRESGEELARLLRNPPKANKALRELMRSGDPSAPS